MVTMTMMGFISILINKTTGVSLLLVAFYFSSIFAFGGLPALRRELLQASKSDSLIT